MKEYKYKVNGVEYTVNVNSVEGNKAKVEVNGVTYEVEMENQVAAPVNQPIAAPAPQPQASAPAAASPSTPVVEKKAPATTSATSTAATPVKAPLPGVINDIKVVVGDKVKNGQPVVILEAMKMENEINAECDGTVTSIAVNKGDSVMEGAVLVTIG